jgi:hypothetical protein
VDLICSCFSQIFHFLLTGQESYPTFSIYVQAVLTMMGGGFGPKMVKPGFGMGQSVVRLRPLLAS